MPTIEHRPVNRLNPHSTKLSLAARDTASQIGQDGILEKIFATIGTTNKFCLEFGAWDGKLFSNTWELIEKKGWTGLLIEANKDKFDLINNNHTSDRVIALNQFVDISGENSLDNIIQRVRAEDPDLLSIDIDGNDWHIWNSLERFRPNVILVEFNPTVPNDVYFVQDASPDINQGSSLLAFIELGKSKGYSLVCAHHWDAFFVRDEFFHLFDIPDNSIDAMFWAGRETKIFQCYDGKLYTVGNRALLWHGRTFEIDTLQVLPEHERRYGDRPQPEDKSGPKPVPEPATLESNHSTDLVARIERLEETIRQLST